MNLLSPPPDTGTLFITRYGEALSRNHLSQFVRAYVRDSGVAKRGSCHLFRHTVATLMPENGADVRFIQQLLGHSDLTSTQVYTHASIRQLQRVHALTHPASMLRGETPHAIADEGAPTREDVLARLEEEAKDDDEGGA